MQALQQGGPRPREVEVSSWSQTASWSSKLMCGALLSLPLQLPSVYAAIRTARLRESVRNELRLHRPACVIAGLSFASYVVAISAKENAAQNTLHIMQSFGVPYLFPFVRSSLDVIGLFQLLTVASVVYGTCKQASPPYSARPVKGWLFTRLDWSLCVSWTDWWAGAGAVQVGRVHGLCARAAVLPHHDQQLQELLPVQLLVSPEPLSLACMRFKVCVGPEAPVLSAAHLCLLYRETGNVMSPSQPSCTWFLQNDKAHAGGSNRAFLFEWAAVHAPSSEEAICLDARVSLYAQFMQVRDGLHGMVALLCRRPRACC